MFQNAAKLFYPVGIGAAFLATSKPEKRRTVMALIVPTALTAMLTGITEPFEFTFLFLAPQLFFVHALLSASLAMTIYSLGVAGHIGGGLIAHISGFVIPLINNHLNSILIYWGVGLVFVAIYFFIFRWAILKFDITTPGREDDDQDVKMFSKQDYKDKKASSSAAASSGSSSGGNAAEQKATGFLEAMGGPDNIADINNCTTRLRISVKDPDKLADDATFKSHGAHGVVRNGQAIQVIVGLDVPKVRDAFESRVNND